jgi:hypothetical protein
VNKARIDENVLPVIKKKMAQKVNIYREKFELRPKNQLLATPDKNT